MHVETARFAAQVVQVDARLDRVGGRRLAELDCAPDAQISEGGPGNSALS